MARGQTQVPTWAWAQVLVLGLLCRAWMKPKEWMKQRTTGVSRLLTVVEQPTALTQLEQVPLQTMRPTRPL